MKVYYFYRNYVFSRKLRSVTNLPAKRRNLLQTLLYIHECNRGSVDYHRLLIIITIFSTISEQILTPNKLLPFTIEVNKTPHTVIRMYIHKDLRFID